MKMSKRMLEAGWNISRKGDGTYEVTGSGCRNYMFYPSTGKWSCPVEEIANSLEQDLSLIRSGELSAAVTSSRLTALPHFKNSSRPVKVLCKNGWVSGKTVLHLGTGRDIKAGPELMESGALEVADYDPNFYPDTGVLEKKYDVIIANYLFNILPPRERRQAYTLVRDCIREEGTAYLTVQGVWPVENKYRIIERHEDGYLIQTGYNRTFRKGYTAEAFVRETETELGGHSEVISMLYSNPFLKWQK